MQKLLMSVFFKFTVIYILVFIYPSSSKKTNKKMQWKQSNNFRCRLVGLKSPLVDLQVRNRLCLVGFINLYLLCNKLISQFPIYESQFEKLKILTRLCKESISQLLACKPQKSWKMLTFFSDLFLLLNFILQICKRPL